MRFCNYTKLTKITIVGGVSKIGEYAFDSCSNLTEIIFAIPECWYVLMNDQAVEVQNNIADTKIAAECLTVTFAPYKWEHIDSDK